MIVSRIWGTSAGSRFATSKAREASVRDQPERLTKPRYTKAEVSGEKAVAPEALHCECSTWRTADLLYQHLGVEAKAAVRDANNRRRRSTYDCYMQWGIRHAIRGFSCGPHPIPGTRQHFSGTYNPTPNDLSVFAPSEVLHPEDCCHNFGLHYARATFISYPKDPPEAEYAHGEAFLLTQANSWDRPDPNTYFYRAGVWPETEEEPEEPPPEWERAWEYNATYFEIQACPGGCKFWYAPPLRDDDGSLVEPVQPDTDRIIKFKSSTTDMYYTHWPSVPGSTKGGRLRAQQAYQDWLLNLWPEGWKFY